MSEDGDKGPQYIFFTESGETRDTSRDYTGYATATYTNGEIYEGDFNDGIREGNGTYRYLNGNVYSGKWKDNRKHGIGKMTYDERGEYNGFWENGRRHGEGIFKYPNGDTFSGWWRFGVKEGAATYYFAETGMKMIGDWQESKITHGKWVYPNGMYYEGEFKDNKPNGEGQWHFPNGNICRGTHVQAKKEPDEDAELDEGEGKDEVALNWQSETHIAESAAGINAIED